MKNIMKDNVRALLEKHNFVQPETHAHHDDDSHHKEET